MVEIREPIQHSDSYKQENAEHKKRLDEKVRKSDHLLRDILNSISSTLASSEANKHLATAQYGNDVAIKAYWKRCGYEEQGPRGAVGIDSDCIKFQFEDVATYQIKCEKPLKPVS